MKLFVREMCQRIVSELAWDVRAAAEGIDSQSHAEGWSGCTIISAFIFRMKSFKRVRFCVAGPTIRSVRRICKCTRAKQ